MDSSSQKTKETITIVDMETSINLEDVERNVSKEETLDITASMPRQGHTKSLY